MQMPNESFSQRQESQTVDKSTTRNSRTDRPSRQSKPDIADESVGQPQGGGPQGGEPQGGGPQGEGPQGEGPQGEGPQGEGPQGEGPQGEGPPGGQPPGGQPPGGQPQKAKVDISGLLEDYKNRSSDVLEACQLDYTIDAHLNQDNYNVFASNQLDQLKTNLDAIETNLKNLKGKCEFPGNSYTTIQSTIGQLRKITEASEGQLQSKEPGQEQPDLAIQLTTITSNIDNLFTGLENIKDCATKDILTGAVDVAITAISHINPALGLGLHLGKGALKLIEGLLKKPKPGFFEKEEIEKLHNTEKVLYSYMACEAASAHQRLICIDQNSRNEFQALLSDFKKDWQPGAYQKQNEDQQQTKSKQSQSKKPQQKNQINATNFRAVEKAIQAFQLCNHDINFAYASSQHNKPTVVKGDATSVIGLSLPYLMKATMELHNNQRAMISSCLDFSQKTLDEVNPNPQNRLELTPDLITNYTAYQRNDSSDKSLGNAKRQLLDLNADVKKRFDHKFEEMIKTVEDNQKKCNDKKNRISVQTFIDNSRRSLTSLIQHCGMGDYLNSVSPNDLNMMDQNHPRRRLRFTGGRKSIRYADACFPLYEYLGDLVANISKGDSDKKQRFDKCVSEVKNKYSDDPLKFEDNFSRVMTHMSQLHLPSSKRNNYTVYAGAPSRGASYQHLLEKERKQRLNVCNRFNQLKRISEAGAVSRVLTCMGYYGPGIDNSRLACLQGSQTKKSRRSSKK